MVRALSVVFQLLLIALPVVAGVLYLVWQTARLGVEGVGQAMFVLAAMPSVLLNSLVLAVAAPLVACYLALWMAPSLLRRPRIQQVLAPLLAVPHVAFAVGMLLLFSPSGWLLRVFEQLTGWWPLPPQGWPLPEKSLFSLTLVLVLKELPFLLLMIAAQLKQLPSQAWLVQAQSYGYSQQQAWWRVLVPELLQRLTLPMAAVVIYSVSVVDIPLLLGNNLQPVLAQQVFAWSFQFAPEQQANALVGAWLLLAVSGLLLLLNRRHARCYAFCVRNKPLRPSTKAQKLRPVPRFAWYALAGLAVAVVLVLLVQSLATQWFYPALWPSQLSVSLWQQEWPFILAPAQASLSFALLSALFGTVAAVVVLEQQCQRGKQQRQWLLLVALFMPQVPLVLGWQLLLGSTQGPALWVLWAHTVYTFPYAYLVLHGAYMGFNRHWLVKAQSLGYSARQAWWRVLLPMLKQPLLAAYAVAFAVSIAQYVPTQWLGQGQVSSLTTEAVSVASGGDWRIGSLYALLQMLLPLLVFLGAGGLKRKSYAEHA
ncbi:ABC transporter permease [Aliidiomarina taiwanensis]|uniref:ABC transporter permease n=1 Tax=Aliidiomarina taiwanensis TaxID=946228 RepID=A0A432X148_9GAMM|nr:ABC transporter permease subunit [Aliidiomarina taiwanensis]RUO39882.1 ABC transporter permease [Aliidiomarina taiwanensis]